MDLDAPASYPRWDSGDGQTDLSFSNGELSASYWSGILRLFTGTAATYNACNTSGFSNQTRLALNGDATVGEFFCVQTSADRIAAAKITVLNDSTIVLSVKVWDHPVGG